MAIRIKQTNNASTSFYSLNDDITGENKDSKKSTTGAKEVASKLTEFSKNVLKSTKNLTFDIVGGYVPNAKDIGETFKEVANEAKEDAKKNLKPIIDFGKKQTEGGDAKATLNKIKDSLNETKKDIVDRLKKGQIYMTDSEKMERAMESQFDFGNDFDFDFSSDSTIFESSEDSLGDEPFTGVHKGVTREVSAKKRAKQYASPARKTRTVSARPSAGGELRLGDELISSTTSQVGRSLLKQNEEIWARTFAAEETRTNKILGYQQNILNGVNAIVDFNNNIMSENVKAQLEFQGKSIAAQQDMLMAIKEVKDTVFTAATYKDNETRSKLVQNGRLNGKEYYKQIKQNFNDLISSTGLGQVIGMAPMIGDMMEMKNDMGMKADPLSSVTKALFSIMLPNKTRYKLKNLNNMLNDFGGAWIGKMNELADNGVGFGKTLGKLLGSRSTEVTMGKSLGLSDPNAIVGWTSKSDRTLNTVIPGYLAKMLVALNPGKEETYYDYKSGKWKTASSLKKNVENLKKLAFSNSTTDTYVNQMLSRDDKGRDATAYKKAFEQIVKNTALTGKRFSSLRAKSDEEYRQILLKGVDNKIAEDALQFFTEGFESMSAQRQSEFNNGGIMKVFLEAQKNLDSIARDLDTYGGASLYSELTDTEDIENKIRSLMADRQYKVDVDKKGRKGAIDAANTARMAARAKQIKEIQALIDSGVSLPQELKDDWEKMLSDKSNDVETLQSSVRQNLYAQKYLGNPLTALIGGKLADKNPWVNGIDTFADAATGFLMNTVMGTGGPHNVGTPIPGTVDNPFAQGELEGLESLKRGISSITSMVNHKEISELRDNLSMAGIDASDMTVEEMLDTIKNSDKIKSLKNAKGRGAKGKRDLYASLNSGYYNYVYGMDDGSLKGMMAKLGRQATNFVSDKEQYVRANKEDFNLNNNRFDWGNIQDYDENDPSLLMISKALYQKCFEDIWYKAGENVDPKQAMKMAADIVYKRYGVNIVKHAKELGGSMKNGALTFSKYVVDSSKATYDKLKDGIDSTIDKVKDKFNGEEGTVEKFSTGGRIKGRGAKGKHGDQVIIRANPGEYILTPEQKERYETYVHSMEEKLNIAKTKFGDVVSGRMKQGAKAVGDGIATGAVTSGNAIKDELNLWTKGDVRYGDQVNYFSKKPIAGKLLGGVLGGASGIATQFLFGNPLLSAAVGVGGAKLGSAIGGLFGTKYRGLRNALLARGYADAPKMNKRDLYAVAANVQGKAGLALRSSPDFEKLEHDVLNPNIFRRMGGAVKKTVDFFKDKTENMVMRARGTYKYKDLIGILNEKLPFHVGANYDKFGIYALALSLPQTTKEEKAFKRTVLEMRSFKELKGDVRTFETFGERVVKKAKKTVSAVKNMGKAIKLSPYKSLVYLMKHIYDQDDMGFDFYDVIPDDKMLYMSIETLKDSKDENKKQIYANIKQSKVYMKLKSRAVPKISGMDRDEAREYRRDLRKHFRARNRYASLIFMLTQAGVENADEMRPAELLGTIESFATATGKGSRKKKDLYNAISKSKTYKLLQRQVLGKVPDDKGFMIDKDRANDSRKNAKSFAKTIRGKFGNKWFGKTVTGEDFDEAEKEYMKENGYSYRALYTTQERLARGLNEFGETMKAGAGKALTGAKNAVKGASNAVVNAARGIGNVFRGVKQKFADGGIVEGTETTGDKILTRQNAGEMDLNKSQQKGLFNFINSTGSGIENKSIIGTILGFAKNKLSGVLHGTTDKNAKNAVKKSGWAAGQYIYLAQMTHSLASIAKVLGGNDKGEVDEHNPETIAGLIKSGGGGNGKKPKTKDKNPLFKGVSVASLFSALIGSGALVAGAGKGISNWFKRNKGEKPGEAVANGFGGILGFNKEKDNILNADGSKKTRADKMLDELSDNTVKNTGIQIARTLAGNKSYFNVIKKEGGKLLTNAKGLAKGAKKLGKNIVEDGVGKTAAKAVKAFDIKAFFSGMLKKFVEKSKGTFFEKPLKKLCGEVGEEVAKKAGESVSKKVGKEALEKAGKEAASTVAGKAARGGAAAAGSIPGFGTIVGAVIVAADAITEFISGYNNAGRVFMVGKNNVTNKMKLTSGFVRAIKSLLFGAVSLIPGLGVMAQLAITAIEIAIPEDWLVKKTYSILASDKEVDELDKAQSDIKDKALNMGVSTEKLIEAENLSTFEKIKATTKANFKNLKNLGTSAKDAYKEASQKYKAWDPRRYFATVTGTVKNMSKTGSELYNQEMDNYSGKKLGMTGEEYRNKQNSILNAELENYPILSSIKNPKDAAKVFTEKRAEVEAEAQALFKNGSLEAINAIADKLYDKQSIGQNRKDSTLTSKMKDRVKKLLDDDRIKGKGVSIREAKRSPLTQFAYYSKGRARKGIVDALMKKAGFSAGADFWGKNYTDDTITGTLSSNHLGGNAVDFNASTKAPYNLIGQVAEELGIEWGGNWTRPYDPPHFELKKSEQVAQAFATGGIVKSANGEISRGKNPLSFIGDKVKARLNPGELILNDRQQFALFNKIKSFEHELNKTSDDKSAVKLAENPMITNDRETLKMLNEALDLQRKIYQEQVRHNNVAEQFFNAVLTVLNGGRNPGPLYKEVQNSSSSDELSAILNTNAAGFF